MNIYNVPKSRITSGLEREFDAAIAKHQKIKDITDDGLIVLDIVRECFSKHVATLSQVSKTTEALIKGPTIAPLPAIFFQIEDSNAAHDYGIDMEYEDAITRIEKDMVNSLKRKFTVKYVNGGYYNVYKNKIQIATVQNEQVRISSNHIFAVWFPTEQEVEQESEQDKKVIAADDRVIKQLWKICKQADKEMQQAADAVLELADETGEDPDYELRDDVETICWEANKRMKLLLDKSKKIKDEELRETVYSAIEELCEGPWETTLQNWAEQSGWDAIGGLEDWAEVTFGDYLKHHDLSVFNR